MVRVLRVALAKQSVPFILKDTHHTSIKSGGIAGTKRHDNEGILFVVRCEKSQFFLVDESDTDLVVAGFVIQTDEIEFSSRVAKVVDSIVAVWDWIFKRESDLVQAVVGDTHAPDKIIDVVDVFLVGFCGEDNRRAPSTETLTNPTIIQQHRDLRHNNGALVWPIPWLAARYWCGFACINCKFEIENGFLHTGRVKAVPMVLDDGDNLRAGGTVDLIVNVKILEQLIGIAKVVP